MKWIALVLFLGISASTQNLAAQQNPAGPKQLTIRIFSTQSFRKAVVTPLGTGNWMRSCNSCTQQPVVAPLHIEMNGSQLLYGDTKPAKQLELQGSFRWKPENSDDTATASGIWKIASRHSSMRVLLTIPSERYIAAVLSGEAAPDEPLESLKAMAVAMRSFALINSNKHAGEGFGLCDSTHCQVSRYGTIRAEIERAVQETAGEMLWSGQQLAKINYTENCGGMTENAGNVWAGGTHLPYLISHPDPYCLRRSAATWHSQIPLEHIRTVMKREGWRVPKQIDSVRVTKRTPAGRAMLLEIAGAGTRARVSSSSFRFAIDRALGWNRIRSDWYTVNLSDGALHFDGKGFGHGVGLCQAGAYEMAAEGRSYREILRFYFPGTEVRITPGDNGWRSVQGTGWTLLTTSASNEVIEQGNTAWTKAQTLFPPKNQVHPVVHAMPATELFRQTTNEPGWILASTRGNDVFLQPASVLEKNERRESTLLHEFLHVLVEQEATRQTPLWLREGLVEALAGTPSSSGHFHTALGEIDATLAHPPDAAASEHAHITAGVFVQNLIQRYGMASVRGWLHFGVPAEASKAWNQ